MRALCIAAMASAPANCYMGREGGPMEKVVTIVTGAAALIMSVATAMLGFTIPGIWTLQSDMGTVKATLSAVDKRLDGIDRRLDAADSKIEQILKRADSIDLRMTAKETDPANIVAQSGLRPDSEFGGIRVGRKLFVLPKTDEAAAELTYSGLKRERITPSTFGYILGNYNDYGRIVPAETVPSFDFLKDIPAVGTGIPKPDNDANKKR